MTGARRALLRPAVEAARTALRHLEPEQVPADLQRVARATGGRLPPPLHDRAVSALDKYSWLRERAAEAWPDADPESDDPVVAASALFVLRPDGWEERLEDLLAVAASADRRSAEIRDAERIARLEAELQETRRRLDEAQRLAEQTRSGTERLVADATERWRARSQALEAELDTARRAADDDSRALRRAREALTQAHAVEKALMEQIRLERKRRGELEEAVADRGSGAGRLGGRDLARRLDDIARNSRVADLPARSGSHVQEQGFSLPAGVRPDTAEAVDAIISGGAALRVLVDGYNLGFQLEVEDLAHMRKRVVDGLRRLARRAPALLITVVWDAVGGESGAEMVDGVGIEYVGDTSADQRLVELAAEDGLCLVVSNDREVRDHAEAHGAVTLWSAGLAEWIDRR